MNIEKTVLAFGAHPDDVEFGCGGTLLLLKEIEYKIIIVDLTRGEKSVHGTNPEKRAKEANKGAKILGASRKIYDLGDKEISLSEEHKRIVKEIIEKYNPCLVFAPYFVDPHKDHENTSKLVSLFSNPVYYYISNLKDPNIGVDITSVYNTKLKAINSHQSQIKSGDEEWFEERNTSSGKVLGVKYGELFNIKDNLNLPQMFKRLK